MAHPQIQPFPERESLSFVELMQWRCAKQPASIAFTFDESRDITYGELIRDANRVAAWLQDAGMQGQRVILVLPAGLEFVVAFLGCLIAGAIAVPVMPPHRNRQDRATGRFLKIASDARPALVIASEANVARIRQLLEGVPELGSVPIESVASASRSSLVDWTPPFIDPESLAFLQYTSGSTGEPRGVMVSHCNLACNERMLAEALESDETTPFATWLPPQHDMGLIGTLLLPLFCGARCFVMKPAAFIQRPAAWLEMISRNRVAISGGPNFAYNFCVQRITPAEITGLDLSSWKVAFNGAETVRAETLDAFAARFGPCGFRKEAFYPCYGLAEATLFVSGGRVAAVPSRIHVNGNLLGQNRIRETSAGGSGARVFVGCGQNWREETIAIADPKSGRPCDPDEVGEIWVSGPHVGQGYWDKPVESKEQFQAWIGDAGPFLRTGDKGFQHNGELFVTGRIKDLIIVRGRNYYPQDLEQSAVGNDGRLRLSGTAAFSVDLDGEERIVIVQETSSHTDAADYSEIIRAIRRRVEEEQELQVHAVCLVRPGGVPRTTSGKVQRAACRSQFLSGSLPAISSWIRDKQEAPLRSRTGERLPAEAIEQWIIARLVNLLQVNPESIHSEDSFLSFALESSEIVALSIDLEDWIGRTLSPALLYEYPTISGLARYLAGGDGRGKEESIMSETQDRIANLSAAKRALLALGVQPRGDKRSANPKEDGIAVIGMGCRFPGANNPEAYWSLLNEGRDAVTEVPAERWNVDLFYDPDPETPGKMYTRWGGFLDQVDRFDAQFFGISPREAVTMDPQQRLLLEVAWEALENAGQVTDRLTGSKTGVFVGISNEEYSSLRVSDDPTLIDPYSGTGVAFSVAVGRISYILGLQGPNLAVDTACSSSLVAVHLACQALRNSECNLALAGGVNLILSPRGGIYFSKLRAMAPDGRCKTFDAAADGYVRGEGCGVIVLKRLADAIADGDPIVGIVRGSAINHDGRSGGLTVPNGLAQQAVIQQALATGAVRPDEVSYIEGHGTGTPLGDPIEVRALSAVLKNGRAANQPLYLASVKTNIGHLEAAAGIAGIVKVLLALKHGMIPPHLHFKELNPHFSLEEVHGVVPVVATPWPETQSRRIAGVSSFGLSGTNGHVVFESHPQHAASRVARESVHAPYVLPLSASSAEALANCARSFVAFLSKNQDAGEEWLQEMCYTAGARRSHHDYRLALVADSIGEFIAHLNAFLQGELPTGVWQGKKAAGRRPKIAFIFPGQGSQWAGMGKELLGEERAFRAALEECDRAITEECGWSLLERLAGADANEYLDQIDFIQPALFAMQIALAAQWRAWGVEPDAVVGHSMGEVAAACVAQTLTLRDGVRVICRRSRLLKRISGKGAMAMVEASLQESEIAIRPYADRVSVAASNSPRATILSGDPQALEEVLSGLEKQEIFCRRVKVDVASHSPQVDELREDLMRELADLAPASDGVPFYSSLTGVREDKPRLDAEYWVRNLREPVRFWAAVNSLAEADHLLFLEVSPHPVLLPSVEQGLRHLNREGTVVESLRRETPERATMLGTLACLYSRGYPVDWHKLYPQPLPTVELPAYAWHRERYWLEETRLYPGNFRSGARKKGAYHPLLGEPLSSSVQQGTHIWEFDLGTSYFPYLKDHSIEGSTVLPGACYVELALSAATQIFGSGLHSLGDVEFRKALVLPAAGTQQVQLVLAENGMGSLSFSISSRSATASPPAGGKTEAWILNSTGTIRTLASNHNGAGPEPSLSEIESRCGTAWDPADFYEKLHGLGLDYGPCFRGIESLRLGHKEALGRVRLPERIAHTTAGYHFHPVVLDGAFQLLAAAALSPGSGNAAGDAYLPTGIESVRAAEMDLQACWAYARLREDGDSSNGARNGARGDVFLFDDAGTVLAEASGLRVSRLETRGAGAKQDYRDWLFELKWKPLPLAPDAKAPENAPDIWMILADKHGAGQMLADRMIRKGDKSILVHPGSQYQRVGPSAFEVRPDSRDDFYQLFRETFGAIGESCPGIIHLWNLNSGEAASLSPSALEEARTLGCESVLYLLQSLAVAKWRKNPRLWLVTRGAQAVKEGSSCASIGQSPIWGLGRVIAFEHPEFQCTRIDLDASGNLVGEVARLGDEIAHASEEDQVAFRSGERLVARLVRFSEPEIEKAVYTVPAKDRLFRLEIAAPGILDTLALRECAVADPGPEEIQIEVEAAGLNFADVMKAMGVYPGLGDGPIPLGGECAGRVCAVGDRVDQFSLGQRVVAMAPFSFGSRVTIPAAIAAPMPAYMTADEAATIPIAFLTAHYALNYLGRLMPGERVLIHSASGGVGLAAIQLAQAAGAEVFATAGTPEKRDFLRAQGVEHVMDSRTLAFADEVMGITEGRGVDMVLNSLPGEAIGKSLSILAPFGRFLEIGKRDIYLNSQLGLKPFQNGLSFFAIDLEKLFRQRPALMVGLFQELMAKFENQELLPLVYQAFPISMAVDAFRLMAQGKHIGKIVIQTRDPAAQVQLARSQGNINADASYLITGGLGALGLRVAQWLVDQGARHLVLLGRKSRSGLDSDAEEALDALKKAGAEVTLFPADAASPEMMAKVMDEVHGKMPPLKGVIHAAGILDDGILLRMDGERLRSVMAPKMMGAWNLHSLTATDALDFFVMFSSAASLVGSPGQGNYAAGNAFMDVLAHYRRSQSLPAISINWGPWADAGLAARHDHGRLALQGFTSIEPAQGIEVFEKILTYSTSQIGVIPFQFRQWMQIDPKVGSAPLLRELASELSGTSAAVRRESAIRKELLAIEIPSQRRSRLEDHLMEQISQVLRLPKSQVDPHAPLQTLGFDSLMALELRNRLEASLGVALSATMAWNYPTIADLTSHLAQRMGVPLDSARGETDAQASKAALEVESLVQGEEDADLLAILGEVNSLAEEDLRGKVVS